jgi:hypothetical protein
MSRRSWARSGSSSCPAGHFLGQAGAGAGTPLRLSASKPRILGTGPADMRTNVATRAEDEGSALAAAERIIEADATVA